MHNCPLTQTFTPQSIHQRLRTYNFDTQSMQHYPSTHTLNTLPIQHCPPHTFSTQSMQHFLSTYPSNTISLPENPPSMQNFTMTYKVSSNSILRCHTTTSFNIPFLRPRNPALLLTTFAQSSCCPIGEATTSHHRNTRPWTRYAPHRPQRFWSPSPW